MTKKPYCPNFSLIVWKHLTKKSAVMTRLRCKSWQCEYCCKINRDAWRSHLKKRIGKMGGDWFFLTMTAHEHIRTPAGSLENIRSNLDRLFKRVRRVWGKIEYVRVYETHEKGAFHVHVVISGLSLRVERKQARNHEIHYKPCENSAGKGTWGVQTWFRRNCRQIGMGFMVHVVRLQTTAKTVNYICKYLTKDLPETPYLRRIQTTQGIGSPFSRKEPSGWQATPLIYVGMLEGAELTDLNLKMKIPASYWQENIVYPLLKNK